MEPTEESLLAKLRRWKCNNSVCGHEHSGPPDDSSGFRSCPLCKATSRRTNEVFAVYGDEAEAASYVVVPKRPTRGKLASMALRYDHSIFMPKLSVLGRDFYGKTPGEIAAIMTTMSQLYEEAIEQGFYRAEKESDYCDLLHAALTVASEDRTAD